MPGSCHVDRFVHDRMPPAHALPAFVNLERLGYPEHLNATVEIVDRHLEQGRGDQVALIAPGVRWSYAALSAAIDRMAHALVGALGLVPGNRVLLRSANNPTMVALYLAVIKAGGVVVATMPLLRSHELVQILDKAEIGLVVCDAALRDEMDAAVARARQPARIVTWTGAAGGELGALIDAMPGRFEPVRSRADDPCLLGFTSGTTGTPKATVHFHRDLLIVCDCYGQDILGANATDRFIGSPPLAFTFGLGGLVLFPFRVGASAILLERAGPAELADAIGRYRSTICFTSPTAYRAILAKSGDADLSSLRKCVSAGEALPRPTYDAWLAATGLRLMDGIGATEMLHIFIAAREEDIRPGATGRPVRLYEAKILDAEGREARRGTAGRLAVRGPVGCRYLADSRQSVYVENGWNITGDTYVEDSDGYFWFQARNDDMIVSAGYNIAGPEVEAALIAHPAVLEAAVVGAPDPDRGRIVQAYVVLADKQSECGALVEALQQHVKHALAPYKYPRSIVFVDALPKTASGKLQRSALRQWAEARRDPA